MDRPLFPFHGPGPSVKRLLLQLNQLKQKSGAKSRADDIRRVSAQIKALDDELARRMHTVPEVQKAKELEAEMELERRYEEETAKYVECNPRPDAASEAVTLCCPKLAVLRSRLLRLSTRRASSSAHASGAATAKQIKASARIVAARWEGALNL